MLSDDFARREDIADYARRHWNRAHALVWTIIRL